MLGPSLILWMFVLPPTVAGIALMLGAGGPGRGGQGEPRRRFGTLGCGLGLLIGYWGLLGQLPGLPPHDANGALFYVFLGSTLAAWFEGGARSSPLVRLPLRVLIAALAPLLYLKNLVKNWGPSEVFEHVGPIALLSVLLWVGLDALARKRPGASVPLALWLAATGLSFALLFSGFAINSQLAGTLAAVLGAATVCAWIWKRSTLAGGAVGVLAIALTTLAAGGLHLSELPPLSALLIAAGPLAAWLAELLGAGRMPARRAVLVRLAQVAIPVAAGVWIARDGRPPPDPYADYY